MRKQDFEYTAIAIFMSHVAISIIFAMIYGTSHPLTWLYERGNPQMYVILSCLICVIPFALFGYMYILSKEYLGEMNKVLLYCCGAYCLLLLLQYGACYVLLRFSIVRGSWKYYVILNYPAGVIFNTISLMKDGLNLWFILTVLPAPLGFYLGAINRWKYEKAVVLRNMK